MAGREGGGGVVGESHGNSEEEQTTSYGRPDTNGIGPTTILIMFRHYFFVLYMWISIFCIYHPCIFVSSFLASRMPGMKLIIILCT